MPRRCLALAARSRCRCAGRRDPAARRAGGPTRWGHLLGCAAVAGVVRRSAWCCSSPCSAAPPTTARSHEHLFTWVAGRRPAGRLRPAARPAVDVLRAADHRRRLADPHLLDRLHGARPAAGAGSSATSTCSSRRCCCWCSPTTTSVLYLGWEGVGLASYLLIGFWQHKPSAATAAKKAFVVNRVGDIGLSLAHRC